jgi:glycosyltransferase involved in cell wall biosynthesis
MKIGIFADRIGTQGGGLETYELGLIKGLMEIDNGNSYIIYGSSKQALAENLSNHPKFVFAEVSQTSKMLRLSLTLPYKLTRAPLDVLHICLVPPIFCPKKYILTVHDLSPFIRPDFYPATIRLRARALLKRGIMAAEKIITVSEATKNDIIKLFDIDPKKIAAIYLGIDPSFRPINEKEKVAAVLKKYDIYNKYILYVGKIQKRKNVKRLIQAFHILRKKMNVQHKLVLVGKRMWEYDEAFEEIDRLNIGREIIGLGHIAYSDLPYLYNGADVFVFPSLFEGFGLPPLEAMACGTPVVAANLTSIPEVVGHAAILVDPYDIASIANGIDKVLTNEELRKVLKTRGLERAKQFSWKKTAKKTLSVYKQEYIRLRSKRGLHTCLTRSL